MDIKMIEFQLHNDERGSLVVAEYQKEIPFLIKRVYYLYGSDSKTRRGYHSHKKLEQIYIAINGRCKVMLSDGKDNKIVQLDKREQGLYIGHNVWREIYDFSEEAVLLVLASEKYDESDYIRDYDSYLKSL